MRNDLLTFSMKMDKTIVESNILLDVGVIFKRRGGVALAYSVNHAVTTQ